VTTVQLTAGTTISGDATGVPGNAELTAATTVRTTATFSQNDGGTGHCDQIIDQATSTVTLGAGTTTLDLTNFTNHLNQTGQTMAAVRVIYFEHDAASLAASVTVFNAAAQAFQGPLSAGAAEVLLPGDLFHRVSLSASGWAVDGTHHNLGIVVAGGTATLRYFVAGSST